MYNPVQACYAWLALAMLGQGYMRQVMWRCEEQRKTGGELYAICWTS